MSGTYPPAGPPYGQPSGNEPPYGSQPGGQPGPGGPPGSGGYGNPPGSGGFGNPPGSTGSGSSAPTYFGPGAQQPAPYGQPSANAPYGQPSANAPYGQPSANAPQGPGGGPTGAYPSPPPPTKKKSNGPLIAILAGAVGLIVVIAIILGVVLTRGNPGTPADPGPNTDTPVAKASKPSDAVQGFLEALAAGDSARALAYAATEPSDKTFLTDEVLAMSKKDAPLTDINVPEVTNDYSTYISATYSLGTTKVTKDFQVEKSGDEYKMSAVADEVDISSTRFDGLPMTINGVEATSDTAVLFPGSYTISTGLDNISYGKGKLIVKSPDDYASTSDLQPTLAAAGKAAFKTAVKSAINTCVAKKSLTPGCGLVVRPTGGKVTTSTIKWKITRNPNLSDFDPRLDYSDPRIAKGYASVTLSYSAKGKLDNGSPGVLEGTRSLGSVSGDLTKAKITVTWS